MTGLTGWIIFLALLTSAVLSPSLAPLAIILALGIFSLWPVDVSK